MDLTTWPKKLFILLAFIACFTCYARPDYNLPLFAFAYLLWDLERPQSQKVRLFYLFIFSWIIDFVWLVYWGPFWNSRIFEKNWAHGIQSFVLTLSVIGFILKLITIIVTAIANHELKSSVSASHLIHHTKNILNPDAPPPVE